MILMEGKDHHFSIKERETYIIELKIKIRSMKQFVFLQTCNRVELYYGDGEASEYITKHLFRVASGLESKMLGEGHILGQIRRAYVLAINNCHISPGLHRLFQYAIHTGKRVRTETSISKGAVTHSLATIRLLKKEYLHLKNSTILIIGVNKLTQNIAQLLLKIGCKKIVIVNRTIEKSKKLAQETGCAYAPYNFMLEQIHDSDIIITAVSHTEPIIWYTDLSIKHPVTIIDLGVPRNVDPELAKNPKVKLFNLEDVEANIEQNIKERTGEVIHAERIIDEEIIKYKQTFKRQLYYVKNSFS